MGKSKHLQKTDSAVRTVRKFYLPLFLIIEALSLSILLGPFRSSRMASDNPISYGTLIFIILNVCNSYYLYNSIKDGKIKDASKSVKRTKDGVCEVRHYYCPTHFLRLNLTTFLSFPFLSVFRINPPN